MAVSNPPATRALIKRLISEIRDRMPSILEAYDDFPSANQKLKFPSFSLFTRDPIFVPRVPYVVGKGDKIEDGDDAGKFPVKYVIGQYEFNLQLDFWCESKFQRHDILEEFIQAFNSVDPTAGITFSLRDYHDECAHAFVVGTSFMNDSEESSQRGEWRVKVNIRADLRAIKEKLENLMETIEYTTETTEGAIQDSSSGTSYTNGTI